jgi:hypothetical protein
MTIASGAVEQCIKWYLGWEMLRHGYSRRRHTRQLRFAVHNTPPQHHSIPAGSVARVPRVPFADCYDSTMLVNDSPQ